MDQFSTPIWTIFQLTNTSGAPTTDSWGYLYAKYNVNPDEINKEYTVSGYIKTDSLVGTGAYFSVYFIDSTGTYIKDTSGQNVIKISPALSGTKGWTRVSYTFKAPANTSVLHFEVDVKGTGTANFDGIQLVNGSIVNQYSSNENTSFEDIDVNNKIKSWDLLSSLLSTSDGYVANDPQTNGIKGISGKGLLRIVGNATANKFFGQYVEMQGKVGDPITVSGWSNSTGASTTGGDYQLRLWVMYTDGTQERFDTNFDKSKVGWQFVKNTVRAKKDFNRVAIYNMYASQTGTSYFDNIKVDQYAANTDSSYDSYGINLNSISDVNNNSTSYLYDENGNNTLITTPLLKKSKFSFDYFNNITSASLIKSTETDPENIVVNYEYDPVGNLIKKTNPKGFSTTYEYNKVNQPIKETDPLGKYILNTYDNNGNLKKIEKGNSTSVISTVHYEYNSDNLLASKKIGTNAEIIESYGYDKARNLKEITLPDGKKYLYDYDESNRLVKNSYPDGYISEYLYDTSGGVNNGQITTFKETVNSVPENTSYTYNSTNMLTKVGYDNSYISLLYNEKKQPVQLQLGDKNTVYQSFNDNGTLSSQKYTNLNINYNYDADGNLIYYNDGSKTQNYTYDFANRLATWNNGSSTVSYNYDKAGNLLNPSGKSLTFNGSNEIDGYIYDEAGNLVQDDRNVYTWNELGQLVSVKTINGTQLASYTYYPNGLRKTKTSNGTTDTYYYDDTKLVRVVNQSGQTKWKITWANGKPSILRTLNGTTYYYVTNYRGDVIQIIDSNGTKVADYSYDPWGNVITTSENSNLLGQPLGYSSYVYDRETSLYYLQARYYKPSDGVFLSKDPDVGSLEEPLTQNGYSYVNGNPIMMVDPDGQFAWWITSALVGGLLNSVPLFLAYLAKYKTYHGFNWKRFFIAFAVGAATSIGGTGFARSLASLGYNVISKIVALGLYSVKAAILNNYSRGKRMTVWNIISAFGVGGVNTGLQMVGRLSRVYKYGGINAIIRYTKKVF